MYFNLLVIFENNSREKSTLSNPNYLIILNYINAWSQYLDYLQGNHVISPYLLITFL